jgi:hypothetical protein
MTAALGGGRLSPEKRRHMSGCGAKMDARAPSPVETIHVSRNAADSSGPSWETRAKQRRVPLHSAFLTSHAPATNSMQISASIPLFVATSSRAYTR